MKKRKRIHLSTPSYEPGWPPDEYGVMVKLVLHDHIAADDLAAATESQPDVLTSRIQPLIDKDFVKASVQLIEGDEHLFYSATAQGREAFFEQVERLRQEITDAE